MPLDIKSLMMQNAPVKAPLLSGAQPTRVGSPMQSNPTLSPSLKIKDTRSLDAITGNSISDNNSMSKNIDIDTAKQIIQHSKKNGIDPYTALAISYQETGINKNHPFDLNPDVYGSSFGGAEAGVKSIRGQLQYAAEMQKKGVVPKGEEYYIQGYNGYGKIHRGHIDLEGANSIYGQKIPAEGIDFKKTPLYGRRVLDIRDNILKKNPEIAKLVSETQ